MDPLDEQLRGAMKALDALVPGLPDQYFDQLPDQIMTRLEDPTTMQPTGQNRSPDSSRTVVPPPAAAAPAAAAPAAAGRVEDSGLHDLKALAQSTKQRMSRRMPTQNPVDDIALGASSSGLRAVALPEPARMVALPELSAVGLEPAAARAKAPSATPVVPASLSAVDAAPAAAATSAASAPAFSLGGRAAPAAPARKSRAPLMAAGAALAAAAGVVGYLAIGPGADKQAASPAAGASTSRAVVTELPAEPVTAEKSAAAAAPAAADTAAAPAVVAPGADSVAGAGGQAEEGRGRGGDDDRSGRTDKSDKNDKDEKDTKDSKDSKGADGDKGTGKAVPGAGSGAAVLKGDQQDQSLDDLLREAGVDPNAPKKADKPTLDKKGLTAGDIRTAMSARAGAAKDCFSKDGPSGNVPVKLTVAPDGSVKSAKAGGAFAGTARGECVAKAAAGASFPAWDGAVMTVNYTYSPPDE